MRNLERVAVIRGDHFTRLERHATIKRRLYTQADARHVIGNLQAYWSAATFRLYAAAVADRAHLREARRAQGLARDLQAALESLPPGSFYGVTVSKAQGIPTLYLVGDVEYLRAWPRYARVNLPYKDEMPATT